MQPAWARRCATQSCTAPFPSAPNAELAASARRAFSHRLPFSIDHGTEQHSNNSQVGNGFMNALQPLTATKPFMAGTPAGFTFPTLPRRDEREPLAPTVTPPTPPRPRVSPRQPRGPHQLYAVLPPLPGPHGRGQRQRQQDQHVPLVGPQARPLCRHQHRGLQVLQRDAVVALPLYAGGAAGVAGEGSRGCPRPPQRGALGAAKVDMVGRRG